MSDHHIVKVPFWVWIIRILQGVLAVVILGLAAYELHAIDDFEDDDDDVAYFGLTLFSAIFTLGLLIYYFLATALVKIAYIWPLVLGFDLGALIFWLASWACLADLVKERKGLKNASNDAYQNVPDYTDYTDYGDYGDYYSGKMVKRDISDFKPKTYYNVLCATLALSLILWFLFIATFVVTTMHALKHRKNGGTMFYGRTKKTDAEKAAPAGVAPGAAPVPAPNAGDNQNYYAPPQQQQVPQQYDNTQQYPPAAAPAPYSHPHPQPSVSPVPANTYEAPAPQHHQ